jgi:hypothetical protein
LAYAWSIFQKEWSHPELPFWNIEIVGKESAKLWLPGRISIGPTGVSSEGLIGVANSLSREKPQYRNLLALDLPNGVVLRDLTPSLQGLGIDGLEEVSLCGNGTLVAFGSIENVQVAETLSGKIVFRSPGRFPRLSPDGKYLAWILGQRLHVRSLSEGFSKQLLPEVRMMGLGGWSPNGRFLTGGGWPRTFSREKVLIAIDVSTSRYAELRTLGEGDYGTGFVWAATDLSLG